MPGMKEALIGAAVAGLIGLGAKGSADTRFAAYQQTVQATPQPSQAGDTPRLTECPFTEKQIEPGQSIELPPNTLVKGDIFVNDQRLFDEKDNTGLVTILPEGGTVKTEKGAYAVCTGGDKKVWEQIAGQAVVEMANNGCNQGPCEWVNVKYGAGGKECKDKEKKHDGKPPSKSPPEATPPPATPPTPTPPPQGK